MHILDNFLTPSYHESIYNLAKNHLQYQYMEKTSWTEDKTTAAPLAQGVVEKLNYIADDPMVKDVGQLSCSVFECDKHDLRFNWAYEQLKPIYYIVKDKYPELGLLGSFRVKFNLLMNQNFGEHYNQPHFDVPNPSYSLLYYLNDSDGDTYVFNEMMLNNNPIPSSLTIKEKIAPKANRAVIFESNRFHASSNPTNTTARFVLNWVFYNGS